MDAPRLHPEAIGGRKRHSHENLGQLDVKEPVQNPAQPVVVEVLGFDARPDEMFGGLADEELLEEVKRGREEAQPVEDHGLDGLPGAEALLGMRTQEVVYLLDESHIVDDASDDTQVVYVPYSDA